MRYIRTLHDGLPILAHVSSSWDKDTDDAAPTALFLNLASIYPTEMLRFPMGLRICRPEAGLVYSREKMKSRCILHEDGIEP